MTAPLPGHQLKQILEAFDALRVPEGHRAELIGGEIVVSPTPSNFHNWIYGKLHRQFDRVCPDHLLVTNTTSVALPATSEIYVPDLLICPGEELLDARAWQVARSGCAARRGDHLSGHGAPGPQEQARRLRSLAGAPVPSRGPAGWRRQPHALLGPGRCEVPNRAPGAFRREDLSPKAVRGGTRHEWVCPELSYRPLRRGSCRRRSEDPLRGVPARGICSRSLPDRYFSGRTHPTSRSPPPLGRCTAAGAYRDVRTYQGRTPVFRTLSAGIRGHGRQLRCPVRVV